METSVSDYLDRSSAIFSQNDHFFFSEDGSDFEDSNEFFKHLVHQIYTDQKKTCSILSSGPQLMAPESPIPLKLSVAESDPLWAPQFNSENNQIFDDNDRVQILYS